MTIPVLSSPASPDLDMPCDLMDDVVAIQLGVKREDPTTITINCPNKVDLASTLFRLLSQFGLHVTCLDLSTDGIWFLLIVWVIPRLNTPRHLLKWGLLKECLISACPSSRAPLYSFMPLPKPKEVYLLQVHSSDRPGLLHELVTVLWDQELTVHKLKGMVSPENKAINIFYVTDTREQLQTKLRQAKVCDDVRKYLGGRNVICKLHHAGPEWGGLHSLPPRLYPSLVEELINEGLVPPFPPCTLDLITTSPSVVIDNSLSCSYTLVKISCKDRIGLIYDCVRTLRDLDIQIAYARLSSSSSSSSSTTTTTITTSEINPPKGLIDLDLFILEGNGKKIVDPKLHKTLCSRLETEIQNPIRAMILDRGPDTELLIAAPIDSKGFGRPRVLLEVSLVLRALNISILKVGGGILAKKVCRIQTSCICKHLADIARLVVGERQWDIFQFLLIDTPESALISKSSRKHIIDRVSDALMR